MSELYVYDPTVRDTQSAVRGVGRYLATLKETLPSSTVFTADIRSIPADATLLNPFFSFLTPPPSSRRICKTQIAVIHDLIPLKYAAHFPVGIKGWLTLFRNKIALRSYDHIITDSNASKTDIVTQLGLPSHAVSVVYPTTIRLFFEKPIGSASSLPDGFTAGEYFVYVGDATWNKNIVHLAHAVQEADVKCVMVGNVFTKQHPKEALKNPWLRDLVEFRALTNGDSRFIFPGFLTDDVLCSVYEQAIANILVSRDEGFGYSYLEAGLRKTPTIAGFIPVQQEIAGETALFAPPENVPAIVEAIRTLKNDQDARDELGARAFDHCQQYTSEAFANNLMEALSGDFGA